MNLFNFTITMRLYHKSSFEALEGVDDRFIYTRIHEPSAVQYVISVFFSLSFPFYFKPYLLSRLFFFVFVLFFSFLPFNII